MDICALNLQSQAIRIGVQKTIGWHSFRHGLATMLRRKGVDIKTAQELLRHANSGSHRTCISSQSAKKNDSPKTWCSAVFLVNRW